MDIISKSPEAGGQRCPGGVCHHQPGHWRSRAHGGDHWRDVGTGDQKR